MSVDTLKKYALQILSNLSKYPIPDIQLTKDIEWFLKKYGKQLESESTSSGYTSEQVLNILLQNAILSGYNFSTPIIVTGVGSVNNLSSDNSYVSDISSAIPNIDYTNRVIGISITVSSTLGVTPDDNDTFYFCDGNGSQLGGFFTYKDITTAQSNNNPLYFGWISALVDDVYSVDLDTLTIVSALQYYNALDIRVGHINNPGAVRTYNFDIKYYLA